MLRECHLVSGALTKDLSFLGMADLEKHQQMWKKNQIINAKMETIQSNVICSLSTYAKRYL